MKQILHSLFLVLLALPMGITAQITTPQVKAFFGVDADMRANSFNGSVQASDDWFKNLAGPGIAVIDTTGASFITSRYTTNPSSRKWPFFRNMAYPQFSIVNNRMLIDAIFIRDHHGDDSTVFASGSNKNGMSPVSWSTPVSQGIPDKNDILDMYMHVRREGPNNTDSLWFFGGVSIDNTTGNRYFDFEMYQTDITYNRPTLSFTGYGPEAGHTAWQFDAMGNVTKAGDIIFTAEYSSSSLSLLEARIWVHQSSLSLTPVNFNWGGLFDGASSGAVYGYASITPKTAGAFYSGLQCGNNTWGGPFQVVLQNDAVSANYSAKQFMEFTVNLSKLGLDPLVTVNDPCAMPFRRILVKSRASTSFTAELKDFVGPFSFFRAPAADIATDFPALCPNGTAQIWVTNPLNTSIYTWRTTDGHIVGDTIGTSVNVDMPGVYIVTQELMDSCRSSYAADTIIITQRSSCIVLSGKPYGFQPDIKGRLVALSWKNDLYRSGDMYEIERSLNGVYFHTVKTVKGESSGNYNETDDVGSLSGNRIYYRLKMISADGKIYYSPVEQIVLQQQVNNQIKVMPNPVHQQLLLQTWLTEASNAEILVYDSRGILQYRSRFTGRKGNNLWQINEVKNWNAGVYYLQVILPGEMIRHQVLVAH
ncbi:MAG: T9SS type A sorting domain-containing protein [Chitinophagaceae bacterium]